MTGQNRDNKVVAEITKLSTRFGVKLVHDSISLNVYRNEILAIVGGSGSGKSTLLREMVLLQRPSSGTVQVFGEETTFLADEPALDLRRRIGVLFQYGALFGGLTVLENVALPLQEHTQLSQALIEEIALMKLELTELTSDTGVLYPNQLSGGMRKRVALARAIALDPELLFLDEPTSGLDPVTANALDELVLRLKESLGLTIVMVTHDIDSLWRVADRVALLGEARVLKVGSMEEVSRSADPVVASFFQGPRGRAAQAAL